MDYLNYVKQKVLDYSELHFDETYKLDYEFYEDQVVLYGPTNTSRSSLTFVLDHEDLFVTFSSHDTKSTEFKLVFRSNSTRYQPACVKYNINHLIWGWAESGLRYDESYLLYSDAFNLERDENWFKIHGSR